MLSIFLMGWFWIVAIETILMLRFMAKDWGGGATVSLIVSLLLLQFLAGVNIWGYILANPFTVILYALGYFAIGIIWSFVKWYFYLKGVKLKYEKYIKTHEKKRSFGFPLVSDHKDDIVFWMSYWPFSLIWTCIDDFIEQIFKTLWNLLKNVYQGVSDRMFKDIKSEILDNK